ncbi:alpha/beta hydrolase [Halosimplex pelagicum]|uniref:Alpha/beta hydrolase n=1 Tax=Halosimplex pelagicum TaxID=869886 RepID=A0A7D5PFI3_9EURY|nr:alpha/beta hydrolase [Halosimplex pelagicum]QLH83300.1 alpha/beta hydrolase [Halosimplex pelagicum]
MSEPVVVPGGRDVRGSLAEPDGTDPTACVVACPPHPQLGGSRSDRRLTAVADALTDRGIACLRFDYGEWGEGRGELRDTRAALDWAGERYDDAALFGYSFGGCLALAAAADATGDDGASLAAVSALAPAPRIGDGADAVDAVAAVERIDCPGQVVYGSRDDTVETDPIVERARERGFAVTELAADHHFVGQAERAAGLVADFLEGRV